MKPNSDAAMQQSSFQMGHAESPDWEKATEDCLQQLGYIDPHVNVGFLYVTDVYADMMNTILNRFRNETGVSHWVGTVGIGICASGKEYHETAAMAVMVGAFPEESLRILTVIREAGGDYLSDLQDWLRPESAYFGIVHGDPRNDSLPQMISELYEALPNGFLVGGLSSSRGDCPQIADSVTRNGLSGILFSDQVSVVTGLTQGCTPIGKKHIITQCERNILIEMDNRPAVDVLYEEIGEILARDPQRISGYIFAGLPVPGSDTGDYVVRNLIGIDTEQKLLAVGDITEQGQTIQFCRRDSTTAWDDLSRMLGDLKQRLQGPPRGGVYYSCLGRGQHLFGEDSGELQAIRKELGEFPLVGFFANGEISHNRLYGYTGVLTLFQ